MTTPTAITNNNNNNNNLNIIKQLKNQSTIYRRHESRLARSYALKDDPRPKFIRILSGLPGFCFFIEPYNPEASYSKNTSNDNNGLLQLSSTNPSTQSSNNVAKNRTLSSYDSLNCNNNQMTMVATAIMGGALSASLIFSRRTNMTRSRNTNQRLVNYLLGSSLSSSSSTVTSTASASPFTHHSTTSSSNMMRHGFFK